MIGAVLRGAAGLAIAAAFGAGLVWLSSRPLGAAPRDAAVRLALRTAGARVEVCRDRTAAELAALPVHMRQPRVCEDRRPDYLLELHADGERLLSRRVRAPGIHGDRPLTVDELITVPPGRHQLAVTFAPAAAAAAGAAAPPSWQLGCTAELAAGRTLLVLVDGPELSTAGVPCAPAPRDSRSLGVGPAAVRRLATPPTTPAVPPPGEPRDHP